MGSYKIPLNFNVNSFSPNARIYPRNILLTEFDKQIKNNRLFAVCNEDGYKIHVKPVTIGLNDVFGVIKGYTEDNGKIFFDTEIIDKTYKTIFKLFYHKIQHNVYFSIAGIGTVGDLNKVEEGYKLVCLCLTDNYVQKIYSPDPNEKKSEMWIVKNSSGGTTLITTAHSDKIKQWITLGKDRPKF